MSAPTTASCPSLVVLDPSAEPLPPIDGTDRVPSSHYRVGRLFLGGCTAWHATHGAFLTGGHWVSTFQAGDGVEFNVPLSQPDGTPVPPVPTGALNLPAGGILSIVAGSHGVAACNAVTITSAMTLSAPMGGVVIGNCPRIHCLP